MPRPKKRAAAPDPDLTGAPWFIRSLSTISKFIKEVGVPVAFGAFAAALLWWKVDQLVVSVEQLVWQQTQTNQYLCLLSAKTTDERVACRMKSEAPPKPTGR